MTRTERLHLIASLSLSATLWTSLIVILLLT